MIKSVSAPAEGYDFIGDVHGCGHKLEGLLERMGYSIVATGTTENPAGVYAHPRRRAVFVGDLVDRGPNQLEVLRIVKAMHDYGSAEVAMGNHELNALAYSTPDPDRPGEFCRTHDVSHAHQHAAFLDQLNATERKYFLEWFMRLPLWIDLGEVRVVHACWDETSRLLVERELGGSSFADTNQLVRATRGYDKNDLYRAVEVLLKGPEIGLGEYGLPGFLDKDGHERHETRVRWWVGDSSRLIDLAEIPHDARSFDGYIFPGIPGDIVVSLEDVPMFSGGAPVVYGHYWRRWEGATEYQPREGIDWTLSSACVDFSAVRGGPLVAYQWNIGDRQIAPQQFTPYW
jgi:hypothetical protein